MFYDLREKQALDLDDASHTIIVINKFQDQTITSRSNIYVFDNNRRDLYLLGVNSLVKKRRSKHSILSTS